MKHAKRNARKRRDNEINAVNCDIVSPWSSTISDSPSTTANVTTRNPSILSQFAKNLVAHLPKSMRTPQPHQPPNSCGKSTTSLQSLSKLNFSRMCFSASPASKAKTTTATTTPMKQANTNSTTTTPPSSPQSSTAADIVVVETRPELSSNSWSLSQYVSRIDSSTRINSPSDENTSVAIDTKRRKSSSSEDCIFIANKFSNRHNRGEIFYSFFT